MANTIKLKSSGTTTAVPSSLEYGELAINYTDGKLFYKNNSSQIVELSAGSGGSSEEALGKIRDSQIQFFMEVI